MDHHRIGGSALLLVAVLLIVMAPRAAALCPASMQIVATGAASTFENCVNPTGTLTITSVEAGLTMTIRNFDVSAIEFAQGSLVLDRATVIIEGSKLKLGSRLRAQSLTDANITFTDIQVPLSVSGTFLELDAGLQLGGINSIILDRMVFTQPQTGIDVTTVGIRDGNVAGYEGGSLHVRYSDVTANLDDGSTKMKSFQMFDWNPTAATGILLTGLWIEVLRCNISVRTDYTFKIIMLSQSSTDGLRIAVNDSSFFVFVDQDPSVGSHGGSLFKVGPCDSTVRANVMFFRATMRYTFKWEAGKRWLMVLILFEDVPMSQTTVLLSDVNIKLKAGSSAYALRQISSNLGTSQRWDEVSVLVERSTFDIDSDVNAVPVSTDDVEGTGVTIEMRDSVVTTKQGDATATIRYQDGSCVGCRITARNVSHVGTAPQVNQAMNFIGLRRAIFNDSAIEMEDVFVNCIGVPSVFSIAFFAACNAFTTYYLATLSNVTMRARGVDVRGSGLAFGLGFMNTSTWVGVDMVWEDSTVEGTGYASSVGIAFMETSLKDTTFRLPNITLDTVSNVHICTLMHLSRDSSATNFSLTVIKSRFSFKTEADSVISLIAALAGTLLSSIIGRANSLTTGVFIAERSSPLSGCNLSFSETNAVFRGADSSLMFEFLLDSPVKETNLTIEDSSVTVAEDTSGLATGLLIHDNIVCEDSTLTTVNSTILLRSRPAGLGSHFVLANGSNSEMNRVAVTVLGGTVECTGGQSASFGLFNGSSTDRVRANVNGATVTFISNGTTDWIRTVADGNFVHQLLQITDSFVEVESLRDGTASLVTVPAGARLGSNINAIVEDCAVRITSSPAAAGATSNVIHLQDNSPVIYSANVSGSSVTLGGASGAVVSRLTSRWDSVALKDTVITAVTPAAVYQMLEFEPPVAVGSSPLKMELQNVTLRGPVHWSFLGSSNTALTTELSSTITSSCVGIEDRKLFMRSDVSGLLQQEDTSFLYAPLTLEQQQEDCPFMRTRTTSLARSSTPGVLPSATQAPSNTTKPTMTINTSRTVSVTPPAPRVGCGNVSLQAAAFPGVLQTLSETQHSGTASTDPPVVRGADVATQGLTTVLELEDGGAATWSTVGGDGVSARCESDDADAEEQCSVYVQTRRLNATATAVSWDPVRVVAVSFAADASLELLADVWVVLQPSRVSLGCDMDNGVVGAEVRVRVTAAVPATVEAQASAVTMAATAGAAAAAFSPGAAMDAQALAVFSLISCSSAGDRYAMKRATFLLSPASLGGGPEGNVVFNLMMMALLMVVPLVLSVGWHKFKQRVLGKSSSLVELHMMLRYPSLYVKLAMLFHQGTAILSLRLVFDGRASVASVIGMLVALVFPWVMYAYGRVLTRPGFDSDTEGRMIFFKYDGIAERVPPIVRNVVMGLFVPVGKWGPGDMSKRFGGTVSSTMPLWTLYGSLPLFQATAVCIVAAVHTGSRIGCMAQFGSLILMNLLFGIAVCIARPYRSGFLVIGQASSSFALVVILGLMAALAVGPERKHERQASQHLIRLMGASGILRMAYSLCLTFVEPRVLRKYLTKVEWRDLRDAPQTKELFAEMLAFKARGDRDLWGEGGILIEPGADDNDLQQQWMPGNRGEDGIELEDIGTQADVGEYQLREAGSFGSLPPGGSFRKR